MPCYARFTTLIEDAQRLTEVLKSMGATVTGDKLEITARFPDGSHLDYGRWSASESFGLQTNSQKHKLVAKAYAEAGVRAFARRQGFHVVKSPTNPLKLVLRRMG